MKRISLAKQATVLLAAVCVTLVGVRAYSAMLAQDWLLQVEGVAISRELYSFFLSEALIEAERDENGVPTDMQALREDIKARAAALVAINSELYNRRVVLDQLAKARVAQRTSALWRVVGNYYTAIGVSKETVGLAQAGLAGRDQLFRALYDTGGSRETPEERIQAFFYDNYAAFQGMQLFFTATEEDGTERMMTNTERLALLEAARELAAEVNREEGPDFFEASQQERFAAAMSYATPAMHMVMRIVDMPAERFEEVAGLSADRVSVLEFDDGLIIARGIDMRESPEEFYDVHRAACLRALESEAFEEALAELFAAFSAEENTAAVDALLDGWDFGFGWRG